MNRTGCRFWSEQGFSDRLGFFFFFFLNTSNCSARGGLSAGRADQLERAGDVPEPANAEDAIGSASEGVGHALANQDWGHVLQRSYGIRKMLHSGATRMAPLSDSGSRPFSGF